MKKLFISIILLGFCNMNLAAEKNSLSQDFYNLSFNSISSEEVPFSSFKGKVLLIVNTASQCGFTSQYEGLEELYQKYKDQGLEILGFPSNDFGAQEPGNNEEIKKFCKLRFGVSFPLFEKSSVKGKDKNKVYKFLTEDSAEEFQGEVGWNFVKFLIDRNGNIRSRHSSMRGPSSLRKDIEKLLAEK